jgi:hypothetical protein
VNVDDSDSDSADGSGDDPIGGRATVAQTLSEVRGLRDLTKAEFRSAQRQLDALAGLPIAVQGVKGDLEAHKTMTGERFEKLDDRVDEIEDRGRDNSEWRRTHMPTIITSIVLMVIAIVTLVEQLH